MFSSTYLAISSCSKISCHVFVMHKKVKLDGLNYIYDILQSVYLTDILQSVYLTESCKNGQKKCGLNCMEQVESLSVGFNLKSKFWYEGWRSRFIWHLLLLLRPCHTSAQ